MNQRPTPTVKTFFLIRASMVAGVVAFLAGLWLALGRRQAPVVPSASLATFTTVMYASVGLAAVVIMVLRLRLASSTYQVRCALSVVSWAVGEFAVLFGGVMFFLTGEWRLVFPGALVFAIALAAVPLPRDDGRR